MMKILYHLTVLPPKMPRAEALSQEINALRHHFGGGLKFLNPNHLLSYLYIPRLLFGFHLLSEIQAIEKRLDVHHVYNPDPFPFPILRRFQRPVVYTISSGVGDKRPNLAYFAQLGGIAVADERGFKQLQAWGLPNAFLVRPGVDTTRFTHTLQPLSRSFKVMVGSAPWTKAQFKSKGVDALLQAAVEDNDLHLIFLWRGELAKEMTQRVTTLNLQDQVTVLDKQVEVNEILAGVHATINLATAAGIVKSYPHSLLDSLAAGKPVLVSQAIPMADYVAARGCGVVVEEVTAPAILAAIARLKKIYPQAQQAAGVVGQQDFTLKGMIASYQKVYDYVCNK